MKHQYLLSKFVLSITMVCFAQIVLSQNNFKITGKVSHETVPLEQVTIAVKNTNIKSISNENGIFNIIGPAKEDVTLLISAIGFQSVEKIIHWNHKNSAYVEVELKDSIRTLQQVEITTARTNNNSVAGINKAGIKAFDLPQAVSIIGATTMADQQVMKLSDVIRNVNGVYIASARASTQESFGARGYRFGSDNLFKNGARVNGGIFPEVSALESVEVLKGSAAIMYGNVAPGGIVNMVTKQPKFEFGGEVELNYGSFDVYKPTIDVYGPLSSKVAFRVNGVYDNEGSYRRSVKSNKTYINPSFLFLLSKKTKLVLEGDYLYTHFTPDFGIGSINDTVVSPLGRETFLGNTWQYATQQQATSTATLNHEFNSHWKLNSIVSYQYYKKDYFSTERIQVKTDGNWLRPLNRILSNEDFGTGQVNLLGNFNTGKLKHQFAAGADANIYGVKNNIFDNNWGYVNAAGAVVKGIYDQINILNFDPSKQRMDIPTANILSNTQTNSLSYGFYAQDLISISDKVKILAGLRWSLLKDLGVTTTFLANDSVSKSTPRALEGAISPRFGFVYQPLPSTSLFVSYSNSFSPNTSGTDVYGKALKPSIIDQYEIGIKNDFFDGKLSANVTVYKIVNNNLVQMAQFQQDGVTPNTNTALRELAGQNTSDGVEVDVSGSPVTGLNILAGYSYNYARYTKSYLYKLNERLVNTPLNTFNTSAFYTFTDNALSGLKLGIAAFYTGSRYGGWNNTNTQTQKYNRLIAVKGYTTVDVSAGYTYQKIAILAKLANVGNVFNYNVHENYSINPIPPRNFLITLSYKF